MKAIGQEVKEKIKFIDKIDEVKRRTTIIIYTPTGHVSSKKS